MAEGPKFIENVHQSPASRSALVSYITQPLLEDVPRTIHQNRRQARILTQVLDGMGFRVDVVHFMHKTFEPTRNYDLLIGCGYPFEASFGTDLARTRIYYAASPSTYQRNTAEVARLRALWLRRGKLLRPRRQKKYPDILSSMLSDAIFCTGNDWAISTYRPIFNGPIHRLRIGALDFFPPQILDRDPLRARTGFLWLGGNGAVLKGLDLCFDAFSQLPDLDLHVCGPIEDDVMGLYQAVLAASPNIHLHDFVDVSGDAFADIARRCQFFVGASASEAGCGAALTAMYTGMIPIVTTECSVDIEDFGLAAKGSVKSIRNAVLSAAAMSTADITQRSEKAHAFVAEHHSFEAYRQSLTDALEAVLEREHSA